MSRMFGLWTFVTGIIRMIGGYNLKDNKYEFKLF